MLQYTFEQLVLSPGGRVPRMKTQRIWKPHPLLCPHVSATMVSTAVLSALAEWADLHALTNELLFSSCFKSCMYARASVDGLALYTPHTQRMSTIYMYIIPHLFPGAMSSEAHSLMRENETHTTNPTCSAACMFERNTATLTPY